jgi:adenylate cyclase
LGEVEFESEDASAAFDPPAWLATEVTGDQRYANESLAVRGAPED